MLLDGPGAMVRFSLAVSELTCTGGTGRATRFWRAGLLTAGAHAFAAVPLLACETRVV